MTAVMLSVVALFLIRLTPGIAFQSVAVAAPAMAHDLGADQSQLGLVLGAFMLPGIAATVFAGLLARRIGDRAVLAGGLVLVSLGGLAAMAATSYVPLLAARVLGGTGGVTVLMLTIKMTTDRVDVRWLSTASGFILTAWPAGIALGLVALGPVPQRYGWHATIGLAALPALIVLLLLPAVERGAPAAFAPAAGRDLGLRMPFFLGAVVSWSLLNAILAIIVGFLPGYLEATGRSTAGSARAASVVVWCVAIMIPLGGLFADRFVGKRASVVGAFVGTAALLPAVIATSGAPAALLIALGLVFAAAPGPLTAQLGQATPAASRAVVFGWYSAGSYTAMTIGPWIAGWLADASADARAPLLFAAALSLGALVAYAVMDRTAAAPLSAPLPIAH